MSLNGAKKVAAIVVDAGGEIVGRTRLQKVAYLLTVVGLEDGLVFRYKHYGPYCEELASAAVLGSLLGEFREVERPTAWGGTYSIFTASDNGVREVDPARRSFVQTAARADAVELELAATAVFLSLDGYADPWQETARRKPEKANEGRLNRAKDLLGELKRIHTPKALPDLG